MRRTEDPLAELARLIGQEDPFADFVAHRPADNRAGGHAGAARRPVNARDPRAGHDPRGLERRRSAASLRAPELEDDGYSTAGDTEGRYSYGGGRAPRAPEIATPRARDDRATPRPASRANDRVAPGYADADMEDAFEQPRTARDSRSARRAPPMADEDYGEYASEDYDPDYDDDAYLPAHGDEFYDEAPRRRLKGWMIVVIAAVGAIIVGTSGLFAYRALFGPDIAAVPAKVISPDSSPTKMVPGNQADKRIQDRIGAPSQNAERIVPREESPIDQSRIPDQNRIPQNSSADRIPSGNVTAASPQFSPPPAAAAPAAPVQSQPPAAPASFSTEPRRVRTVTVRADGSVVSDSSRTATAANTARTVPAAGATNPLALQGGQSAGALPPPRPNSTTSSAPLQGDNPWSNLSSGQVAPSGQVGPQAALPPPPAPAPAPAPAVAVNTPPPAGSYVVQVAAQKSEAEAQSTWQTLQQRYPRVLGGQQAQIRRVDLGERGVFYRAQVGPFQSRTQASEVCQGLKAAGGDCVIQRN